MSWKKVISIVAVGALLGVPLQTLGDNDRNGRGGNDRDRHDHDRYDRDRHDRDHQQRERERQAKKKAEREAQFRSQLIARFTPLAGSGEYATPNATSLVDGVRNGTSVTLKSKIIEIPPPPPPPLPGSCGRFACPPDPDPVPVEREVELTFDVPTGAMKYTNVAIALALMEAKLKDLYPGVVTATGEQIRDVLAGGSGILTMRVKKLNWIQIAYRQGLLVSHTTHVKGHDDDDDDNDD